MAHGTVLVIDDDPALLAVVRAALEDAGYRVLTASNWEAQGVAHEMQPALILLDIMMPGLDGVTLGVYLHTISVTAAIPIVLMSAQVERLRNAETRHWANDYLAKPFDLNELYAIVARWIPASVRDAGA